MIGGLIGGVGTLLGVLIVNVTMRRIETLLPLATVAVLLGAILQVAFISGDLERSVTAFCSCAGNRWSPRRSSVRCRAPRRRAREPRVALYVNRSRMPSSGMPWSAVLQVSPGLTGMARVSVPVVTISPAASGGLILSLASSPTRWRSAASGPSRTFAALPRSMCRPSQRRSMSKRASFACHSPARARDRVARPDQQRGVHAVGGDGIGGAELPLRIDRLHDLESVRDPFEAGRAAPPRPCRRTARRQARTRSPARCAARQGRKAAAPRSCRARAPWNRRQNPRSARRRRIRARWCGW